MAKASGFQADTKDEASIERISILGTGLLGASLAVDIRYVAGYSLTSYGHSPQGFETFFRA